MESSMKETADFDPAFSDLEDDRNFMEDVDIRCNTLEYYDCCY